MSSCAIICRVFTVVNVWHEWVDFHVLEVNLDLSGVLFLEIVHFSEDLVLCLVDQVNNRCLGLVGNEVLDSLVVSSLLFVGSEILSHVELVLAVVKISSSNNVWLFIDNILVDWNSVSSWRSRSVDHS